MWCEQQLIEETPERIVFFRDISGLLFVRQVERSPNPNFDWLHQWGYNDAEIVGFSPCRFWLLLRAYSEGELLDGTTFDYELVDHNYLNACLVTPESIRAGIVSDIVAPSNKTCSKKVLERERFYAALSHKYWESHAASDGKSRNRVRFLSRKPVPKKTLLQRIGF